MQDYILQKFQVNFEYPVCFTQHAFALSNPTLSKVISRLEPEQEHRLLFVIDSHVAQAHPYLLNQITEYTSGHPNLCCTAPPMLVPGGEAVKNDQATLAALHAKIFELRLCRHSFLVAIGGGAVLDMAGYAAALAHRGLRLVRLPTTVLAQNDSGVGVKNGLNAWERKNFLGTFAPPFGVINDFSFLTTLEKRDWLAGTAEAVKVALLKDWDFFYYLEENAPALVAGDQQVMRNVIRRCAQLHLEHIRTSGDPFEYGTCRPLDFGHWAAHKLEDLSYYRLRHGEAVASGMALDSYYSCLRGLLSRAQCHKIFQVLQTLGFKLYQPEMEHREFLTGLQEFREHLGGQLSVPLLTAIGKYIQVNHMSSEDIKTAIAYLKQQG